MSSSCQHKSQVTMSPGLQGSTPHVSQNHTSSEFPLQLPLRRHFHSKPSPANHIQHCTMRRARQCHNWLDTERGVTSARQTSHSRFFLSVIQAAPTSVPVMSDAHGSPRHPGPSGQGSFHISQTASSFHAFEQGATSPCCLGQIPTDRLHFQ